MDRKKKYYYDILHSITAVEDFTTDIKTFSQYQVDRKTKSAVERQLSIIGEATKKIRD